VIGSLSGSAGQQSALAGSVLNMLGGQGGNLEGLVQTMKDKGLGAVAASWVGTGANQPITADQVGQILNNDQLRTLAAQHGLNVDELKSHLAQILPVVVDKLTPGGSLPASGGLAGMLRNLVPGAGS
jgi:uncharacterized protein YidB (DUF937 family)